jgi:hypothetical protein
LARAGGGALAFDVLILYNGELCTVKKNWENLKDFGAKSYI